MGSAITSPVHTLRLDLISGAVDAKNAMDKLVHSTEFFSDVANGTLPTFSYIILECCTVDSMHPTSNMAAGEQLIKHVHDALRNSQYWEST
jgi:phospholipase C